MEPGLDVKHDGRHGRLTQRPDSEGDVTLEWADTRRESGYIKKWELTRLTQEEFLQPFVRHASRGSQWPCPIVYY